MEEKLKEFRQRKRREQLWNTITLKSLMDSWKEDPPTSPVTSPKNSEPNSTVTSPLDKIPKLNNLLERTLSNESIVSVTSSNASAEWSSSDCPSQITVVTYALYALLWLTCWLIAIQMRFGAVYLVTSGIVGIYLNTRTRPKQPGEISAYSVFNPNCESIDGTLKAEQFEKEFNLIHHSPPT